MDSEAVVRPIPFTHERAATELISTRRHLEAARDSLALALRIVGTLSGGRHPEVLTSLERVMRQLEGAQAALGRRLQLGADRETGGGGGSPAPIASPGTVPQ